MTNKSRLVIALFSLLTVSTFVSPIFADDEVRNLQLDLKAKGFSQNDWFDNLDSSNIIMGPNTQFQIRLTLKNAGNRNQTQIKSKILLPSTIKLISSVNNTVPSSTANQINIRIPELAANQDYSQTFTVQVKDKPSILAQLTKSTVTSSAISEIGTETSDSLYFYTSGGAKNFSTSSSTSSTLPSTGANTLVLGTALSMGAIALAFALRKYARGY